MQSKLFEGLNFLFVATSENDLGELNRAIEQAKLHGANDIQLYKLFEDPDCFSLPTLSPTDTKLWFLERFNRQGRIEPHFIVATNTSFAFYRDIAFDLLIPVVSPLWIHSSVRLQHLAKTFNYSPDPFHIFRNFEFYISRDSFPTPAERLFYKIIIMSLGGMCTNTLSQTTDYIVTKNTEDIAIKAVLRFGMDSSVKFVYPTWLVACFKRQKLLDDVPHFVGCNDPEGIVPRELWKDCHSIPFTTQTAHPRDVTETSRCRTRARGLPRRGIFNGYKFILNDDLGLDYNENLVLGDLIKANGGDVLGAFDGEIERITHRDRRKRCVMVSYYAYRQTLPCTGSTRTSPMEQLEAAVPVASSTITRRKEIPIGNLIWLFYMCKVGRYVNPEEKLIFRPFEKEVGNKQPRTDLSLSYSNYFGFQRPYIILLTKLLGGRATSDFSKENKFLVCRIPCGRKYEVATTAWKDRCTVVTHLWLEDCLRVGRQLYPSGAQEYKRIPLQPYLSQMINQKKVLSQQDTTDNEPALLSKRLYSKTGLQSLTHENNLVRGQLSAGSRIRTVKSSTIPTSAVTPVPSDDTTSTPCGGRDTTVSTESTSTSTSTSLTSPKTTDTEATTPDDRSRFTAGSSPDCIGQAPKKLTAIPVTELGVLKKGSAAEAVTTTACKNLDDGAVQSITEHTNTSVLQPALVVTRGKRPKKRRSTSSSLSLSSDDNEEAGEAEHPVKRVELDDTAAANRSLIADKSDITTTAGDCTVSATRKGPLVNSGGQSTPATPPPPPRRRRRTRQCQTAILETPGSAPATILHSSLTGLERRRMRFASLSPYAEIDRRGREAELKCEAFTILANLARRFKRDTVITEIPRIYSINAVVTNCLDSLSDLDLQILAYLGIIIHRDIDAGVESQLNGVIAPKQLRTAKFLRSLAFTPLRYALLPKFVLDLLGLIHDPIIARTVTEGSTFVEYLTLSPEEYQIPEISRRLLGTTELPTKVFERAQIRRVNIVQDITGGVKTIETILKAHGIEEVAVLKGRSKREDILRNTNEALTDNGPGAIESTKCQSSTDGGREPGPKFVPDYVIIVQRDLQAKRYSKLLKPVAEPLIVEWGWCVQCIFNLSVDYTDLRHVKRHPRTMAPTE